MRICIAQKTLYSVLCDDLSGNKIPERGDICICIADSLYGAGGTHTGEAWRAAVHGVTKSRMQLGDRTTTRTRNSCKTVKHLYSNKN